MPSDSWRCPACGKFAQPPAFQRGAQGDHVYETGRPGGRGRPWSRKPMSARLRRALAALLRDAADQLVDSIVHPGEEDS